MQRYLLDTHSLLWFLSGSNELSGNARTAIADSESENCVSIVSFWEIAIKASLGKLTLIRPFQELATLIVENGFEILPVSLEDTLTISQLPFHHRDPFDRMLVAQSISNKLLIISKDKSFADYGVNVLW